MHSSSAVPLFAKLLQRGQPPSLQLATPRGVPLYPVEIILLSFTINAATFLFTQLLLVAIVFATLMKYSSHPGLSKFCGNSLSIDSTLLCNCSIVPSFTTLLSAKAIVASSCCEAGSLLLASIFSSLLNSPTVFGSFSRPLFLMRSNLFFAEASTHTRKKFPRFFSASASSG